MDNNRILKKVAIAANLRHEAVAEIFRLSGNTISPSQIRAFMAGPANKNFQALDDAMLEAFLDGLITYSRGTRDEPEALPQIFRHLVVHLAESERFDALEELTELAADALIAAVEDDDAHSPDVPDLAAPGQQ